ncbi:hypothetical protein [Desulfosporosinus sp. FKB]|uniref:hypothetical protein n=1 Tax=Desulfosporosinus sp. FKB TaxID=1969835 RepID=UPI000B4987DD|nr:hypothetical protein [Desulfosporosinus sp. FKB]
MKKLYIYLTKIVFGSKRMIVTIILFIIWFTVNGYFLKRMFRNINDDRLNVVLKSPVIYIHDKVFNPSFSVLLLFPLFILLVDLITNLLLKTAIVSRYKDLKLWWKVYYISILSLTLIYVGILNVLLIILVFLAGLKSKIDYSFLIYFFTSIYFQINGFVIIANIFTSVKIITKNQIYSFLITSTIFILMHYIFYYMILIGKNAQSFEMYMFLNSKSNLINYIWFIALLFLSNITAKKLLNESDLI